MAKLVFAYVVKKRKPSIAVKSVRVLPVLDRVVKKYRSAPLDRKGIQNRGFLHNYNNDLFIELHISMIYKHNAQSVGAHSECFCFGLDASCIDYNTRSLMNI